MLRSTLFSSLLLLWSSTTLADQPDILIGIKSIAAASTVCKTDSAASATTAASQAARTGNSETVLAGEWLRQPGAKWTFYTDDPGVTFENPHAISQPKAPPKANSDAVKLDPSGKKWTLTIPTKPDFDSFDVNYNYLWTVKYPGAAAPAPAAPAPHKNRVRAARDDRRKRAGPSPTYTLKFTGEFLCSNSPDLNTNKPYKLDSGTIDPAVSTQCAAGSLPTGADAWSKYNVPQVIKEVFDRAPGFRLNYGGFILKTIDVGTNLSSFAGKDHAACKITSQCPPPACKDLIFATQPADNNTAPLWLANKAYVNFANWMASWSKGLETGAIKAALSQANLAQTYFTNEAAADSKALDGIGAVGSFLSLFAGAVAALTPAGAVVSEGLKLTGVAVGVLGSVGGTIGGTYSAAKDKKSGADFALEYNAALGAMLQQSFDTAQTSLLDAYGRLIGQTQFSTWDKIMGNGYWLDKSFDSATASVDFTKKVNSYYGDMFHWRTINYAYSKSETFIIYVPYGKINDGDGKPFVLTPDNCMATCKEAPKCFCDKDPKSGMARLYRATAETLTSDDGPNGLLSKLSLGAWTYNVGDIIKGSLNSWLAGDFGYDIEKTVTLSNPEDAFLLNMLKSDLKPTVPGIFNLPVCQVFDLRSFPRDGNSGEMRACGCQLASARGGKDPKKLFKDNVSAKIKKAITKTQNAHVAAEGTCDVAKDFQT